MMALATLCFGAERREWSAAMEAEFEIAAFEGRSFAFASGCLIAAWRDMPMRVERRWVLANHLIVICFLVPLAAFQFIRVAGLLLPVSNAARPDGFLMASVRQNPALAWSQLSALPALSLLWVVLGVGQLILAWFILERDRERAIKLGALIGATMVTLFLLMEVLLLDVTFLIEQGMALAIALAGVVAGAQQQARLFRQIQEQARIR
jgi:hypothetical protein